MVPAPGSGQGGLGSLMSGRAFPRKKPPCLHRGQPSRHGKGEHAVITTTLPVTYTTTALERKESPLSRRQTKQTGTSPRMGQGMGQRGSDLHQPRMSHSPQQVRNQSCYICHRGPRTTALQPILARSRSSAIPPTQNKTGLPAGHLQLPTMRFHSTHLP